MRLLPTQPVPELDLALVRGGTTGDLSLGTGAGGRFTMVVFYRGLHCPICRQQLTELDRRLGDLKAAGIGRVLAVSMETQERSDQVVDQWHLNSVPVAYGLTEAAARDWGLNLSQAINDGEPALFNEPGVYILDQDRTLFWASTATMPFGRPAIDEIITGVRYAQEHNYPARGAA
ncbi:redoxin domain-containing protein [Arthrobacter sp. CAN_C5]|nr:redoxin domain-containing protein [Arthrobacter sp. CAN_C5]